MFLLEKMMLGILGKVPKIVEGKTLQGSLDGAYDNDYYKFVVPENGTYEIYAKIFL